MPENNFKTCTKCDLYSYPLRRCIQGKINPPTLKGTKEAMSFYLMYDGSPNTICIFNKWKSKAFVQLNKKEA